MNLKELVIDKTLKIYTWFFKTKPTPEIKIFIESLFYVFIATGISKLLFMIINILGGRLLGPTTYGEYTLIVSTASFLMLPFGLAVLGGLVKELAPEKREERLRKIISTAFNYYLITLIVFSAIYLIFYKQFADIIHIGPNVFLLTVLLAILWSTYSIYENSLKGLHKQKEWSIITIISYVLAAIGFAALFYFKNNDILLIYLPTIIIYLIFSIISTKFFVRYYSLKIDKSELKEMFNYGFYVLIITIATTFLGNVDKLMLNYFLGAETVGIYQAYHFSSIMLIGVLVGIFVSVFFPTIVKMKDPAGIMKKLDKSMYIILPIVLVIVPIIQFVIIYLYNYSFSFPTAMIFTIATVIDVLVAIYSSLLIAQGTKSIRINSMALIFSFILNLVLNYILIPIMGLNGAIIATAISFMVQYIIVRYSLKYLIKNGIKN